MLICAGGYRMFVQDVCAMMSTVDAGYRMCVQDVCAMMSTVDAGISDVCAGCVCDDVDSRLLDDVDDWEIGKRDRQGGSISQLSPPEKSA